MAAPPAWGKPNFDSKQSMVTINRTEALDASRAAVRDQKIRLPRRSPIVEMFARHMAADAKVLDEDEATGAKKFRYVKTGTNHFSLAFTYAWLATTDMSGAWAFIEFLDRQLQRQREGRG